MSAHILDGKAVSSAIRDDVRKAIEKRVADGLRAPGLAVVILGEDPASAVYVRNKHKACAEVGIVSHPYELPTATTEIELLALIEQLNQTPHIDGILVQLPLPDHICPYKVIDAIAPQKDVDGFHPYTLGRLSQRRPLLRPCTPLGIVKMLAYYAIDPKGMHAVIVGASNIVGRPLASELLILGATTTVCHRFTRDLASHVKAADLLVVAVGKPGVVDAQWIKPGAIVFDVGINRTNEGTITGDLDFAQAEQRAGWLTPVPGGVGPMTVACLMQNTLLAASQTTP